MEHEPAKPETSRAAASSWLEQAQKLAAVIGVASVLIFGVLLLAYGQFYRELGVSLNDVGVEYGKALGGAAGLTLAFLFATTIVSSVVWFAADRARRHVAFAPTMFCTFAVLVLIAAVALPRWANARASAVKHGRPVESVRMLGVEILSVRAAPAFVQVVQSEQNSMLGRTVRTLEHPLFYLGQGRGEVVLYDQPEQRAIFIPANLLALLQTINCETHFSPAKICKRVVK